MQGKYNAQLNFKVSFFNSVKLSYSVSLVCQHLSLIEKVLLCLLVAQITIEFDHLSLCFIAFIHFLLCTIVSPPAPEYSNGVGDHHSQNSSYESQNISPEHVYSFEDFETDALEASGDELVFIFISETQGGIMC